MKKKVSVFGKSIPVFVIALMGIALVSAALVSVYAGITGSVTATAPITMEQGLFTFDSQRVLNDGNNHYLLVKGFNSHGEEVPAIPVITITKDEVPLDTNAEGIHLALDAGADMHYCYDPAGDMTDVISCDEDYVQWLINNPEWFDWVGTEPYSESGFVSPIINHNGDSWYTISQAGGTWVNGVMTLPADEVEPGMFAALLVIRADIALEPGNYVVEVEFVPVP